MSSLLQHLHEHESQIKREDMHLANSVLLNHFEELFLGEWSFFHIEVIHFKRSHHEHSVGLMQSGPNLPILHTDQTGKKVSRLSEFRKRSTFRRSRELDFSSGICAGNEVNVQHHSVACAALVYGFIP